MILLVFDSRLYSLISPDTSTLIKYQFNARKRNEKTTVFQKKKKNQKMYTVWFYNLICIFVWCNFHLSLLNWPFQEKIYLFVTYLPCCMLLPNHIWRHVLPELNAFPGSSNEIPLTRTNIVYLGSFKNFNWLLKRNENKKLLISTVDIDCIPVWAGFTVEATKNGGQKVRN